MPALRHKTLLVVSLFNTSITRQVGVGGAALFGQEAGPFMLPPEMREMAVLVPPPQTREQEPPPNQTRWARPQTCQALPRKTWERFPRAAKELHALGYNL